MEFWWLAMDMIAKWGAKHLLFLVGDLYPLSIDFVFWTTFSFNNVLCFLEWIVLSYFLLEMCGWTEDRILILLYTYFMLMNCLFFIIKKRKKERKKMMSYLMYVFFANLRGSLWIIFYFIAPKQEFYGISCSPYLCSLGDSFFGERYHVKSTWFLCSLFAYFGQFGENKIKELLKTRNKLIKR